MLIEETIGVGRMTGDRPVGFHLEARSIAGGVGSLDGSRGVEGEVVTEKGGGSFGVEGIGAQLDGGGGSTSRAEEIEGGEVAGGGDGLGILGRQGAEAEEGAGGTGGS